MCIERAECATAKLVPELGLQRLNSAGVPQFSGCRVGGRKFEWNTPTDQQRQPEYSHASHSVWRAQYPIAPAANRPTQVITVSAASVALSRSFLRLFRIPRDRLSMDLDMHPLLAE
jgi:hypothetical protein